jgi:hypothetical protein
LNEVKFGNRNPTPNSIPPIIRAGQTKPFGQEKTRPTSQTVEEMAQWAVRDQNSISEKLS